DAAVSIYEELFVEAPDDADVGARLDELYRGLGRRDARIALRERQIAASTSAGRRIDLRLDLATLRAGGGDTEGAIAALRDNLEGGLHAPSAEMLAELYEAAGHHAALVELCEARAAMAEASGDPAGAAALWTRAAELAERRAGDPTRAI